MQKNGKSEGFEIFIGSQSDENFWNDFADKVGSIDVLLDDGGHTYEQQIITTECVLECINDGGVLLIEDTHTSYMDGFGPRNKSFIEYVKKRIDAVNQRFGKFHEKSAERRFWSIEIVESMVAFKIDKEASNLVSEPTNNSGKDDSALDFRHADIAISQTFKKLKETFTFLKYLPFINKIAAKIAKAIKKKILVKQFSASKYFK